MIVRESLDFERGLDPKRSMDIGVVGFDKIQKGDVLQCIKPCWIDSEKTLIKFYSKTENEYEEGMFGVVYANPDRWKDKLILDLVPFEGAKDAKEVSERIKENPNYGQMLSKVIGVANFNTWRRHFKIIRPENL